MDKIVCFGKNYLDHAKELGDAIPEKPVIFLKPPSVLKTVEMGQSVQLKMPIHLGEIHHECEIVIRLNAGGYRLTREAAVSAISHVSVGLDMTLRTLQATLKKNSHPWTLGKVFPDAAVIGPWIDVKDLPLASELEFSLSINDQMKQVGKIGQMMMAIPDLIVYASEYFPLCKDDILFTGTPAGVGPVKPGDLGKLKCGPINWGFEVV